MASFVMALSRDRIISIFKTYAAKICHHVDLPPATYNTQTLNIYIMALPLGEAHAALDAIELENLPWLGDTVSLNDQCRRISSACY